jgi:hypothetical protein
MLLTFLLTICLDLNGFVNIAKPILATSYGDHAQFIDRSIAVFVGDWSRFGQ